MNNIELTTAQEKAKALLVDAIDLEGEEFVTAQQIGARANVLDALVDLGVASSKTITLYGIAKKRGRPVGSSRVL